MGTLPETREASHEWASAGRPNGRGCFVKNSDSVRRSAGATHCCLNVTALTELERAARMAAVRELRPNGGSAWPITAARSDQYGSVRLRAASARTAVCALVVGTTGRAVLHVGNALNGDGRVESESSERKSPQVAEVRPGRSDYNVGWLRRWQRCVLAAGQRPGSDAGSCASAVCSSSPQCAGLMESKCAAVARRVKCHIQLVVHAPERNCPGR